MKTNLFFFFTLVTSMAVFYSCNKEEIETNQPNSNPLSFTSLMAEKTTITINELTKVTATATGEGLTYTWALSGTGSLIGSGYQITYQPCCIGQNTINCIVKDSGDNQEYKSVMITVLEE